MASHDFTHNESSYSTLSSFRSTIVPEILFPHNTSTPNTTSALLSDLNERCNGTFICLFSSEGVSANVTNSTNLENGNWFLGSYGNVASVILFLVLASIIVGTIVGNVLVCTAVCLVRKLRRPYNYLIVSLAVSDLCVAILVMPISMLYEIMGTWPFGPTICDFWVSFDVISCTASILNLCMISVDRYYAITKPLQYGVKRTPKRMLIYVLIVWISAIFISLPPILILGNEKTENQCIVCQNFGYQLYATVCAFYLPLTVMIVVYYKIFQAARKIVKEERKAQLHLEPPSYLDINMKNGESAEAKLLAGDEEGNRADTSNQTDSHKRTRGSNTSTNTSNSIERIASSLGRCFSSGQRKSNESQCPMLKKPLSNHAPVIQKASGVQNRRGGNRIDNPNNDNVSAVKKMFSSTNRLQTINAKETAQSNLSPHIKKLRFQLAKEKKASTTLGIIMFSFIICWLPFFVLALVRPFLEDQESIPIAVTSLFLWLGYANSLLNPIIYATLNKDFRKPFQQILFFRCSNLNHVMREDFYHSQYGEPTTHYCAVNSFKPQSYDDDVEIVKNVGASNAMRNSATFL